MTQDVLFIKTMADWQKSGLAIDKYIEPGDIVDFGVVRHFAQTTATLPDYVQCSKTRGHVYDNSGKYRPTFATFTRRGNYWEFCGYCKIRETREGKDRA